MKRNCHKSSGKASQTPAIMEPLEQRLLLSGHVSAAILGGNLVIAGDGSDNQISVNLMPDQGKSVITPTGGTFVNKSSGSVTLLGVVQDVQIKLNAGNDTVSVSGASRRDLIIDTGQGNDAVGLHGVSTGRNAKILTGLGNADVFVESPSIRGDLVIDGDRGYHNALILYPSVGGDLRVTFGTGQDSVSINRLLFGAPDSGGAATSAIGQVANLHIATGGDADRVYVNQLAVARNMWISTGSGEDSVMLAASTIAGNSFITTGSDNDVVGLDQPSPSLAGSTFFYPFRGPTGLQFKGRVVVDTGFGNDTILVGTFQEPCNPVTFNNRDSLTGGTGKDRLVMAPVLYSSPPVIREIERTDKPDLLLSDLQVLSWSADFVDFRYKVSNIGDKPANLDRPTPGTSDNVRLLAYLDDNSGGSVLVGTIVLSGKLDSGQSISGTFVAPATIDPIAAPGLSLVIDSGDGFQEVTDVNNTGQTWLWPFLQVP